MAAQTKRKSAAKKPGSALRPARMNKTDLIEASPHVTTSAGTLTPATKPTVKFKPGKAR